MRTTSRNSNQTFSRIQRIQAVAGSSASRTREKRFMILLSIAALILVLSGTFAAQAQTAPSLGTAANFGVLGGSTVTNTGATRVTGDVGVSPGSAVTGFPPGVVVGTIHTANATAQQAQADATTAYNFLSGQACTTTLTGQDLGGLTLTPGVYCFSSSAQLTGILTLDALGDPDAVFIFQIATTLTTASGSSVRVINGGQNCNVYFAIGSSATLGSTTSFAGNILAVSSITLNTGAGISGRALARTGAVTLDTNNVNASAAACGTPPPIPPDVSPPFSVICPSGNLTVQGQSGVATVTLSAPAPSGGTLVMLTSSDPARATVPPSVVVPSGSTSATFTVTPGVVPGPVTISASTAGGTVGCTLTIAGIAIAVPALDYVGLAILVLLLAGTAMFAMNRFS
jgi:hypothetical protein